MKSISFHIILILCFCCASRASCEVGNSIVVSKAKHVLIVLSPEGDTLCTYHCAVGENIGQKQTIGDKRTPEGLFNIQEVLCVPQESAWEQYGPFFIRLNTPPFTGIGIHGTNNPDCIGSHCSEGCVRLHNEDVTELVTLIKENDYVTILPDDE